MGSYPYAKIDITEAERIAKQKFEYHKQTLEYLQNKISKMFFLK